ncbi:MAG: tetratricopeptide repeat protein [Planctomycetaceae bacterium]|nr:tetratricopeptide repeat protein [Planctomycetaceae bacterium]
MRALSKIILLIGLVVLFGEIFCSFTVTELRALLYSRNVLNTARETNTVYGNETPNRQLQYYKDQYSNGTITSGIDTKSVQLMGGYPNNLSNAGNNINSNINSNNSGNNFNNIGEVYVAAGPFSRNMLPTKSAIDSTAATIDSNNSNNVNNVNNVNTSTDNTINNLNTVHSVPTTVHKSNISSGNNEQVANVSANLPSATGRINTSIPNFGNVNTNNMSKLNSQNNVNNVNELNNNLKNNSANTNLSSGISSLPNSDIVTSNKPDTRFKSSENRLKPTDSLQEMMLNPKKLKSLIPSFLLRKKVDDPLGEDDGLEAVEKIRRGNVMSEQTYIDSVTGIKTVVSKDIFIKAKNEEETGNYLSAIDLYKEFIRLNSKRTTDGALAVPYHRLALIAWNQQRALSESDICFRYALKYAKEEIIQTIVNDYNKFLTECGKFDQAEAILRNTISLFPYEPQLKVELGRCLARQDRTIEALRHIRPILGEAQAYVELAMIYKGHGDYEMAEALIKKRDEFITKSNMREHAIASTMSNSDSLNKTGNNIRNDNSEGRLNNNIVRAGSNNSPLTNLNREFAGQRDIPFALIGRNVSNNIGINVAGVNNDNNGNNSNKDENNSTSDFPVDPFNIAANAEVNSNIVFEDNGQNGVTNHSVYMPSNNNNNNVFPVSTNQNQNQPESIILPSYRMKGYHYSVEDIPPIFLQY